MEILYEDKHLLVVVKPAGMLTVGYPGSHGRTVIDTLTRERQRRGLVHGAYKPYAVHRLDKDTSGVLLVALDPKTKDLVMDTWQTMVKKRTYRALTENPRGPKWQPLPEDHTISLPLIKNAAHHTYAVDPSAAILTPEQKKQLMDAVTHFTVLEQSARGTLFELELETGRTNQIRAHLAYYGYPLAGDELYRSHINPCGRLCLHARTLEFVHPYTKELLSFEVPEPAEWAAIAKR